jgi:hypothetical protein
MQRHKQKHKSKPAGFPVEFAARHTKELVKNLRLHPAEERPVYNRGKPATVAPIYTFIVLKSKTGLLRFS